MFAQEKKALMEQVAQVAETLNSAHQEAAQARQEAQAAKARCIEEEKKAKFFASQASAAKSGKEQATDGSVRLLQQKLKESQLKVRDLELDLAEYREDNESKDYEIKMLREQKATLAKLKGSKNKQQEVVNQLNAQVERDVTEIISIRSRE